MLAIHLLILALIGCALGVLFASQEKGFRRLRDVLDIVPIVKPKKLKDVMSPDDPRFSRVEGGLMVSTLKTLGGIFVRTLTIALVAKQFGWQDQLINEGAAAVLIMSFMSYWHSANTALFMVRARKANPADPREAKVIEAHNETLQDARKTERKALIEKLKADPRKAKQLALLLDQGDDVPVHTPWLLKQLRNTRDGINFVFDKLMPKMPEFQRRAFARFVIAIAGLNRLSEDPELYFFSGDSNAFASGPLPFMSVMAVSDDLLEQWLPTEPEVIAHLQEFPEQRFTRGMMKSVLAHESGHIFRKDILVNAIMTGETTILSLLVDVPLRLAMAFVRTKWVEALLKMLKLPEAARALGLDWLMRIVGQLMQMTVSQLTKVNLFFVIRSRESGADAFAFKVTGKPLDHGYALKGLVGFVMWRRESRNSARKSLLGVKFAQTYAEQRMESVMMSLRTITFIDALYDSLAPETAEAPQPLPKTGNVVLDLLIRIVNAVKAGLNRVKRAWDSLFMSHPSIKSRIWNCCFTEFGKTGYCPVFDQPNPDRDF